jgi:pimeloyl-ACP methyl ester carboxylesterase
MSDQTYSGPGEVSGAGAVRKLPGTSRRGIRRWLPPAACLGLAAVVTLAGCGTTTGRPRAEVFLATSAAAPSAGATPSGTAPATPAATPAASPSQIGAADRPCLSTGERRKMFVLNGPGRDRLAAVSIGTGNVAVILAHQVSGSLCEWWPYARSLAKHFRVVAFDFDGFGGSPTGDANYPGEVVAAADWARHHGSRRVVLMGASMGGTAVVVAAARLGNRAAGVIDLSGPATFGDVNALGAARHVHVPVLFGYAKLDNPFASDVRRVRAATPARDKPVVSVGGLVHGVDLVVAYAKFQHAVLRFIQNISE